MKASQWTYIAGLSAAIPFYFLTQPAATSKVLKLPEVPFIHHRRRVLGNRSHLHGVRHREAAGDLLALLLSASQILASVAIDAFFLMFSATYCSERS